MKLQEWIQNLTEDRREVMLKLVETIEQHIPSEFQMKVVKEFVHFVVPLEIYPNGYHCTPGEPLPFVSLASQKNNMAIYHMGLYMMPKDLEWFQNEYPNYSKKKLDMGKSCIRFKKAEDIPFELIGKLMERISAADYIEVYESHLHKGKK